MPEIMETTFRSRFCLHFFIYRFELDGRLKHRMGIFFGRSTKNFTEKICNQKWFIDIVSEGQIDALPWIAEGYYKRSQNKKVIESKKRLASWSDHFSQKCSGVNLIKLFLTWITSKMVSTSWFLPWITFILM